MAELFGTLHVVATPIGNLSDITLRAIEILRKVDIILAEDTRVTKKLLGSLNSELTFHYQQLVSYHQHSKEEKKLWILGELSQGKNIALVTDAGTPGISDPGNELISYLLGKIPQIKIVPIPGASAIITALSISGFDVNKFVFLGFMPKKKKSKLLNWLKEGKISFVYYDSPHRVVKNLLTIQEFFGDNINVFVSRELTKLHETLYRGTIDNVIEKLQKNTLKGETVVVVQKNK